jgi:starvation-inducible DNA-binding protein
MFANPSDHSSATIIPLLNARLADTIDLLYQAKQAHWNVTGSEFFSLHELFDKVAHDLREPVDDMAERVAQLGGHVEGTIRMAAAHSSLPEYPRQDPGDGAGYVLALTTALSAASLSMRDAIDQADGVGDPVTADIFTGVARTIDKLEWMVRAHAVQTPARPYERDASRDRAADRTTRTST